MPRYETRAGHFGIISGVARSESDLVMVAPPAALFSPESRKGQLYIVAEVLENALRGHEACQLIMRTIRRQFYEDSSFSVTASLRKAIISANRVLYEQNFHAPAERRALIGLTCIVLKEHDMYIAQIAPAHSYVLAGGSLRAIPASGTWGAVPQLSQVKLSALGASLTVEPEFFRSRMLPGDAAFCCSSNLAATLDRPEVLRLLRHHDAASLANVLRTRCREHDLLDAHVLTLSMHLPLAAAADDPDTATNSVGTRLTVGLRRLSHQLSQAANRVLDIVRSPVAQASARRAETRRAREEAEQQRLQELPDDPPDFRSRPPAPQPLDLGPTIPERIAARVPPSALLGEDLYDGMPERRSEVRDVADVAPMMQRSGARSGIGEGPLGTNLPRQSIFERVGDGLTGRLRRRRRNDRRATNAVTSVARPQGLSYRRQSAPFPWQLLLLIVAVVAVLILYGTNISRETEIRNTDNILISAEQAMAALRDAPNEAAARELLQTAENALDAVRATGRITATVESQRRFEELNREFVRAQAAIQKLTYFEDLESVTAHPLPGGLFDSVVVPPPPSDITDTVAFGAVYVLDRNGGVLYSASKEGGREARPILRPEDIVGPVPVGNVRGMDWRFDNIVAVAQSGDNGPFTFYFRNRERWSYSILAGSEEWGRVSDRFRIANYQGNLYVWGATRDNVLRYLSGEYGNFPLPWIQNDGGRDLESVVDLAVDGKIYLLQPDGRVLIFAMLPTGERVFDRAFDIPPVDPPIISASRFYVSSSTTGSIFLLESGTSRIIQLDKETGAFIQQIRAQSTDSIVLDQMIDLYVDESSVRPILYIVNGGEVVRGSLPDRPRPFGGRAGTATPATTPLPSP
jgi:hypothetical protein